MQRFRSKMLILLLQSRGLEPPTSYSTDSGQRRCKSACRSARRLPFGGAGKAPDHEKERTMRTVLLAASFCTIALAVSALAASTLSASAQTARPDSGPLTIARQGSFFVGGREVKSDTLSTLPAYAPSGT